MKKINLAFIILGLIFFCHPALAQEGYVDCGFAEIDLNALTSGTESAESFPELVCLGEKILTNNSSSKVLLGTEAYGDVEFYIERGDENQFTGKITLGAAADMSQDDKKPYAETFFVCSVDIGQIEEKNPTADYNVSPGLLVIDSYLELLHLSLDSTSNSCAGTYFAVTVEEEAEDKRVLYSDLITPEKISEIENKVGVTVSENIVGCEENGTDEEYDCIRYFYGSEKNQYNNPAKNFSIRIFKQNRKVDGKYSLSQSLVKSAEKFVYLVDNVYLPTYFDITDDLSNSSRYSKGNYKFLKYLNNRKIIVLKSTWVLEFNYTDDVDDEYASSVIEEMYLKINDFIGMEPGDMSGLATLSEKEGLIGEEEEKVIEAEEGVEAGGVEEELRGGQEEENITIQSQENKSLFQRLVGKIVLKVEENGEAYYIDPVTGKMYYLGRPEDAFAMMRDRGIGITTDNLSKIPIGIIPLTGPDSDGDGLSDMFEDAIKTDKNNQDSDGDSYSDENEVKGGFDPLDPSGKKWAVDYGFSGKQLGKIFLQVEDNGEAWYVNPSETKRYFLGRPTDAFNIMRTLGLGISNNDFASLEATVN